MRSTTLTLAVSLLALVTYAAEPLKVLIIDGQNNHKWDITTPVLKDALEGSGAFRVEVSTTSPQGSSRKSLEWMAPEVQ